MNLRQAWLAGRQGRDRLPEHVRCDDGLRARVHDAGAVRRPAQELCARHAEPDAVSSRDIHQLQRLVLRVREVRAVLGKGDDGDRTDRRERGQLDRVVGALCVDAITAGPLHGALRPSDGDGGGCVTNVIVFGAVRSWPDAVLAPGPTVTWYCVLGARPLLVGRTASVLASHE